MKNLSKTKHKTEQVFINEKIEEMLSVLEKRNKLIADYYRNLVLPDEEVSEADDKVTDEPVL